MNSPIQIRTFELPSHCIVTLKVGTNYTPDLFRSDVETRLSLHFSGAYPMTIKGLKAGDELAGFDLTLTGIDEMEQLITALEMAATELRRQVAAQSANSPQPPANLEDHLAQNELLSVNERVFVDRVPQAENIVMDAIVFYGTQLLPSGEPVAYHLLDRLAEQQFTIPGCAELWQLSKNIRASGQVPDPALLQAQTGPEGSFVLAQMLAEAEQRKLSPNWGNRLPKVNLQNVCDYAVLHLELAQLQRKQDQLLSQISQDLDDPTQIALITEMQEISRQVMLRKNELSRIF